MSFHVSFDKLYAQQWQSLYLRTIIDTSNQAGGTNIFMANRNPWIFIPTLYFAEGLPYTIVMTMGSAIYLKDLGASNELIGLTSFISLPWTVKFLWAPLVDFYGVKKNWIVVAQLVLAVLLVVLAATTVSPWPVEAALIVFAIAALASATHDVAIDAYYLEALPEEKQALFVGVRNTAYRLAAIFGSGGMVVLAGYLQASQGKAGGWLIAYGILAVVLFALSGFHKMYLPLTSSKLLSGTQIAEPEKVSVAAIRQGTSVPVEPPISVPPKSASNANLASVQEHPESEPESRFLGKYGYAIASYFHQPGIVAIVFYILLFRLGDALMLKMASNFLLDPRTKGGMGLSVADVGVIYGTVGIIFLLLGGIVGGWLISKGGVKRWLWPTAIFQNAAILLYWLLALARPGNEWVYVVNSIEQFAYGLGCATYTVFMLGTVKPEFKAAHYAVATGMMAMGVMLPGAVSGYIMTALGYSNFFLLSFFAAIPGIIAIFFLPIWKKELRTESA